jgi:hypothetical protein
MEFHRADKAHRTRSLLLLAFVAALCAVLLWQLDAWLSTLSTTLATSDEATVSTWLRVLFGALGIGLAVPAAALGLSLRKLAYASRLEGRFPPNDWKTWRDVRVLRDAPALAWARRVEMAGTCALAVAALLLAWTAWALWRFA